MSRSFEQPYEDGSIHPIRVINGLQSTYLGRVEVMHSSLRYVCWRWVGQSKHHTCDYDQFKRMVETGLVPEKCR